MIFSILDGLIARSCLFVGIDRSTFYRLERDRGKADAAVIGTIQTVLEKSPSSGFWQSFGRMHFKGFPIGQYKNLSRVLPDGVELKTKHEPMRVSEICLRQITEQN